MKNNVGSVDRIARLVLAAVLAGLYFTGTLVGSIGIAALAVAAVMLVTAAVSFCPIYSALNAMFGSNGVDEDPHKSGVCCGSCGGENSDDDRANKDGPPILS